MELSLNTKSFKSLRLILIFLTVLFIQSKAMAQEIDVNGSLNTSSEQRYDRATGIGIMYNQLFGDKWKLGIGMHYYYCKNDFVDTPNPDNENSDGYDIDRITSKFKGTSVRCNFQRMFKNNEYVSFSLGPEISYVYFWGTDQIHEYAVLSTNKRYYVQNNEGKTAGFGIISQMEVKQVFSQNVSICFSIKPEVFLGYFVHSLSLSGFSCTEFQIGLKYRFKQKEKNL